MTDDEFWEHVANNLSQHHTDLYQCHEPEVPDHIEIAEMFLLDPCPECGATGACGYDDEGRALIHAIEGAS